MAARDLRHDDSGVSGPSGFRYWLDDSQPTMRCIQWEGPMPTRTFVQDFGMVTVSPLGQRRMETPFGNVTVEPYDVTWVPAGVVFRGRELGADPHLTRVAHVPVPLLRTLVGDQVLSAAAFDVAVIRDAALGRRFVDAHMLSRPPAGDGGQALRSVVTEVLHRVPDASVIHARWTAAQPESEVSGGIPETIRRARAILESDQGDTISVQALADACGLSREHLTRAFKRAYWLSPHQWLVVQRAKRARRMLEQGCEAGIAAQESGFADQSHLHRWFRQLFVIPPGLYRDVHDKANGRHGRRAVEPRHVRPAIALSASDEASPRAH